MQIICIAPAGWKRLMSHHRQSQWSHRLQQLQALRERYSGAGRYDWADKAHLLMQRLYDRWADEVFATAHSR